MQISDRLLLKLPSFLFTMKLLRMQGQTAKKIQTSSKYRYWKWDSLQMITKYIYTTQEWCICVLVLHFILFGQLRHVVVLNTYLVPQHETKNVFSISCIHAIFTINYRIQVYHYVQGVAINNNLPIIQTKAGDTPWLLTQTNQEH